MIYFDAVTFATVTAERLRRTRTPASWAFVLWQLASIPLVHGAMALERVLHPDITRVPVREPLFVVGSFRSGTTFILRLLAADPANACFTTFELGLPSPTLRRVLPARFRTRAAEMLARHLAPLDDIHPLRLDEPEEDELLFLHLGNSAHYELLLPLGRKGERRVRYFWQWPRRKRDAFGAFHRACVQRLLRERGVARYVSKSPHLGGRIDDVRRWYPDARFVHLVRSPLETIPSALSMAAAFWRAAGIDARCEPAAMRALYRSLVELYARTEEQIARLPNDVVTVVRYPDLIAEPARTLAAIYARLGWSFAAGADLAVRSEIECASARRSRHRYDLAAFDLTEETIRRDLGFVFAKHGFLRGCDTPPGVSQLAARREEPEGGQEASLLDTPRTHPRTSADDATEAARVAH